MEAAAHCTSPVLALETLPTAGRVSMKSYPGSRLHPQQRVRFVAIVWAALVCRAWLRSQTPAALNPCSATFYMCDL